MAFGPISVHTFKTQLVLVHISRAQVADTVDP